MSDVAPAEEAKILQEVIVRLGSLSDESRLRLIQTISTYYGLGNVPSHSYAEPPSQIVRRASTAGDFANHADISPKEFLREKQPHTDVERVACLAFYLAHYRDSRHFKTLDISKVNTEAAQPKFSNPSLAVSNAARTGYLTDAPKGHKQISAAGEQFVLSLPDREAARQAMIRNRPRRGRRSAPAAKS